MEQLSRLILEIESHVVSSSSTSSLQSIPDDSSASSLNRLAAKQEVESSEKQKNPFGDFFASASVDTTLRIWDARKKSCIQSYKGHNAPIMVIHHSHDGRWIASGDEDGCVKLWDLTVCKFLKEMKITSYAITSIDFHPNEFIVGVGTAAKYDRHIRARLEDFSRHIQDQFCLVHY